MSLLKRLLRKAAPAGAETANPVPSANMEELRPPAGPVAVDDEQILTVALEAHDTASVARLVKEAASTRVRQLAARAIEDPDLLRRLLRDTRGGNDKSVYQILRQKCDELLAVERQTRQTEEAITARCASLERLSKRHYDELFIPTLEHFEAEWKSLEPKASFRAIAQAQHAISRCREVVAQHREKTAAQATQAIVAAQAAAEAERKRAQDKEAAAIAAAAAAAQREAEEKARAEHHAAEAVATRQLAGLIRHAGAALRQGSTARAAGLRRAIDEKVRRSPPLPTYLAGELQKLDARLSELKDWKDYAAAPKRMQLIEAMEALVGSQDDPGELAVEIKRLQDEWKTISKGVAGDTAAEWQRFHQAAQSAYEPCRDHFEAMARQRIENLERRVALVARLAAFEAGHDWDHADWSLVTTALRESRQQWRSYSPVDRMAGKAADQNFDAIVQRLQERLKGEYARNISEKQSLIARAQKALAIEDGLKAIAEVKHLQQRWKASGLVPREEDGRLWDEFRQACDAIFQKRQREHEQHLASLEGNKDKAVMLCEGVETIATLTGQELTEKAGELPKLREAFNALGELPKAHARDLHRRFEQGLEKCERSLARKQHEEQERSWIDLFGATNRIRAYRLAVAEGKATSELDALKQMAELYIAQVQRWPKGGLQALKTVLCRSGADDIAANEASLRMLCIRAEVASDQPTPASDQSLRREYQMKRLMQGMGQASRADADAPEKLVPEWVQVGASRPEVYDELLLRFAHCMPRIKVAALTGSAEHVPQDN